MANVLIVSQLICVTRRLAQASEIIALKWRQERNFPELRGCRISEYLEPTAVDAHSRWRICSGKLWQLDSQVSSDISLVLCLFWDSRAYHKHVTIAHPFKIGGKIARQQTSNFGLNCQIDPCINLLISRRMNMWRKSEGDYIRMVLDVAVRKSAVIETGWATICELSPFRRWTS